MKETASPFEESSTFPFEQALINRALNRKTGYIYMSEFTINDGLKPSRAYGALKKIEKRLPEDRRI